MRIESRTLYMLGKQSLPLSSSPIPCSAPSRLSKELSFGRGKVFFLIVLVSSLELSFRIFWWRLQTVCAHISMPRSLLVVGSAHEKKFTLTFSIILRSLGILSYPRNGCILRRNELLHSGGQAKRPSTLLSCASNVLRTLRGLTFLILVTTLWDKPCHYPHITDGNSSTARLQSNIPGSAGELRLCLGKVSPESTALPTVPCLLALPKRPIKHLMPCSECGKHSINDNFFCCVYNYYNDFLSCDSSLVSNLTHRQELQIQRVFLELLEFLIFLWIFFSQLEQETVLYGP